MRTLIVEIAFDDEDIEHEEDRRTIWNDIAAAMSTYGTVWDMQWHEHDEGEI